MTWEKRLHGMVYSEGSHSNADAYAAEKHPAEILGRDTRRALQRKQGTVTAISGFEASLIHKLRGQNVICISLLTFEGQELRLVSLGPRTNLQLEELEEI